MNNNSKGGFLHGFLWGAIIAGIVVFLLTSKKGRKILKLLTDEGLDGISELEELLGEKISEDDFEEPIPSKKIYADKPAPEAQQTDSASQESSTFHKVKSVGRRFFKGVPRRN